MGIDAVSGAAQILFTHVPIDEMSSIEWQRPPQRIPVVDDRQSIAMTPHYHREQAFFFYNRVDDHGDNNA